MLDTVSHYITARSRNLMVCSHGSRLLHFATFSFSRFTTHMDFVKQKKDDQRSSFFLLCTLRTAHVNLISLKPPTRIGQAFPLLVAVSSMRHRTSTPALSTSSSSRGVTPFGGGGLILRGASRLDAFSVYPFPAWLLGCRPGGLTDAPAAGPSRSSRTKDSSSQISYAHAG